MKKIFVVLVAVVLVAALSACADGQKKGNPNPIYKEPQKSSSSHIASDNASAQDFISAEQAQDIVFEHAGVAREDVTGLETNLEFDDDWQGWEYDIEFNVGATEYESEVNAVSGTIIKFYKDKY